MPFWQSIIRRVVKEHVVNECNLTEGGVWEINEIFG